MVHPLLRSVATGLLAGFSGAVFAALAADLLHLSAIIAGLVAGFLLAVVVANTTLSYTLNNTIQDHLIIDGLLWLGDRDKKAPGR